MAQDTQVEAHKDHDRPLAARGALWGAEAVVVDRRGDAGVALVVVRTDGRVHPLGGHWDALADPRDGPLACLESAAVGGILEDVGLRA